MEAFHQLRVILFRDINVTTNTNYDRVRKERGRKREGGRKEGEQLGKI